MNLQRNVTLPIALSGEMNDAELLHTPKRIASIRQTSRLSLPRNFFTYTQSYIRNLIHALGCFPLDLIPYHNKSELLL